MTATRPPTSAAAPTTIASSALPPRVRRVLQNLLDHIATDFVSALNGMLVEFEQQLFKQAEQARSNNAQAQIFVDLRSLQKNRGDLVPHYMFALEATLAGIRSTRPTGEQPQVRLDYQTLTLVEDAVMDQEIVLREVARRHEQRGNAQIMMLGQRFGVLACRPAYEAETLPLGPYRLCHLLKDAAQCLDLSIDAQLVLYRSFDHKVMLNYTEWANTVNQFLAREGILPGLAYTPRRARNLEIVRPPSDEARGGARPMTSWQSPSGGSHWATLSPEQLHAVAGALTGTNDGDGQIASSASAATGAAPADAAASGAPAQAMAGSFEVLQKLLSIRRGGLQADALAQAGELAPLTDRASGNTGGGAAGSGDGGGAPGGGAGGGSGGGSSGRGGGGGASGGTQGDGSSDTPAPRRLLPTPDVLGTLQTLQKAPLPARTPDQPRRTVADLQQAMLAQVRATHGPGATLASADSDTFELLDLLYNEIEREVQHDAPAADMLVRLQVPVVQAALRDRNFFLRAQHPARDLLNTVAESGATWLGDDDVDPHLVQRLHKAVETVVETYEGDEAVFEDANRDVQQHLQAAARKAELAERRQIEAARGKDRLEIAKQRAVDTIESAMAEAKPQKFVQALLSQAWADVLTLTQLRNGESSTEWADQLQTTLEIVAATTTAQAPDPALAGKIEKSLVQVGYHEDEAAAIARRLSSAEEDESTSRTELTARLKARARLGGQGEVKKKPVQSRTPQEQECYDYLRTLPFGTWFEFTRNQQGDVQRQRLSWFSPVTGNALFVNQRGQRVGEHSLDTLAHLMAKGQAQVVTEDRGRLIDRAWNATLSALRSLTGRGGEPAGDAA
ncbi:DUF1631 domain-containing protein [Pseudoxanthomonas sp. LH2527]|uniref:DUF1631 domain-containing protein n=1 Tax=Pseudoxanthomonas sp. LH2527 TaxID=2923249 RepID=UPI001F142BFE|nr:DUF1631 domain-containing protein [Pseudoxanthomonas sp. LH2527]MCH6482549.1 DUF1631 domain-containing protein [Pseudoxanthomonas sp. LH2527]